MISDILSQTVNDSSKNIAEFFGGGVFLVLYVVLLVFLIVGTWKLFVKAGHPGWASIIPIFNTYTLIKIAGKEWWWLLLLFVPLINVVVILLLGVEVAKRFGYGTAFGAIVCGLLGIGYAIIGFSGARYTASAENSSITPSSPASTPAS